MVKRFNFVLWIFYIYNTIKIKKSFLKNKKNVDPSSSFRRKPQEAP